MHRSHKRIVFSWFLYSMTQIITYSVLCKVIGTKTYNVESFQSTNYGQQHNILKRHGTVLSVFNNNMEIAKRCHILWKSDFTCLFWTKLKLFQLICICFCFSDSITFDAISFEDRETKHGKVINCKLFSGGWYPVSSTNKLHMQAMFNTKNLHWKRFTSTNIAWLFGVSFWKLSGSHANDKVTLIITAKTVGKKFTLLNYSLLIILTGKFPAIGAYWFLFSFWRLSKSGECKLVLA